MSDENRSSEEEPVAPDRPPVVGAVGGYRVQLELFEGPLDLLLHLIKRDEVDIRNIPLASVTEQYLAYVEMLRDLNLDVAGEFLVMAATLTLIKSRMLLPSAEPDDEEEGVDPRADLIRQLLEYQRYREAAQSLGDRPRLGRDVFAREPGADGVEPEEDARPQVRVTMWQLLEAFRRVLARSRPEPVHEVQAEAVSLRDRVHSVLQTLSVARSVTFDSLFDDGATRGFVIVTFLALLELMKMGAVAAVQEEELGEILIVLAVDDPARVTLDLVEEYDGEPASPAAAEVTADE
jgi:segregation and condensation protein A